MPIAHGQRRMLALILAVLGTIAIALGGPASALAGGSATGLAHRSVDLQLLSINDFHGNLEPPGGSSGRLNVPNGSGGTTTVNAGGVTYLATWLNELRQGHPNSITVSAGDNIGASPLISGYFHDEPAIEALNALGLQIASVGNHEFDEGPAELMRMQNGGCRESTTDPPDSCPDHTFTGANFEYLSANVVWHDSGKTLFPAYTVRNVDGVKVAFIGVTLKGTPTIVTPAGTAGLDFLDEATTVNKYVDMLKHKQHIETFVVLIHEGGFQASPSYVNTCDGISGAITDIVKNFSSRVDVVLSGHTHQPYNCVLANNQGHDMIVTSASSFGRVVTDVELKIDRATGDVYQASANNVIVTRDVPTNPAEDAIIATYNNLISAVKNAQIGTITADLTRTANASGEQSLGDVIADSQLDGTSGPFGAQIALMNPGGIRADIICNGTPPCPVTFGDAFQVEPFGNDMWIKDLTGDQLRRILEQQFDNPGPGENRFLQVSHGFTYTWSASAPIGSKVQNMMLNGVPIDMNATYTVAGNAFLMGGGDNFTVLKEQANYTVGMVDLDTLVSYFQANSPVAPGPQNRYTMVP
jgi:5'-nucleotidase